MKKALIPITAALLTFSMLSNSASAQPIPYFAANFCGSASGWCWIFTEMPVEGVMPTAYGSGRLQVRGFAIVREYIDYIDYYGWDYWANTTQDPNTGIWAYRTQMSVGWNDERLAVHMWTSEPIWGIFIDDVDWFVIAMSFAGWYKDAYADIHYIRGNAVVELVGGPDSLFVAIVLLYIGPEHFLTFAWVTEEIAGYPTGYLARSISHRVTVWPIELALIPG